MEARAAGETAAASAVAAGLETRKVGAERAVRRGRAAGALTPMQERILGHLAMRCASAGSAVVSKAELAQRMGCCMKTVDRAVSRLKAEGYIEVESAFDEVGGQVANTYRLGSRAK